MLKEEPQESTYDNISKISPEYQELIGEYCTAIKKHFDKALVSICIFGSVARGEATPQSDIDILVVAEGLSECFIARVEETAYIHRQIKQTSAYRSLKTLGRSGSFSTIFLTKSEVKSHPPILLDILDDGIILYDKDSFLKKTLHEVRERLKKLGAKKVATKKGHYWVLKPDIKPGEVIKI